MVLTSSFNVVRRVVVFARRPPGLVHEIEQPIKSNSRPPQRSEVESPHSHILRLSYMDTKASDTWPAPLLPGPLWRPAPRGRAVIIELESTFWISRACHRAPSKG